MNEFLAASLSFPTVVFTVLLGIAAVYWIMVIAGALGMDALDVDGGGHDLAHGDLGHGDVGHGDAGHGDGGGDGSHGDGPGILATLLITLKLDAVPMTIVLSLIFFWGWLLSQLSSYYVLGGARNWVWETLLLLAVFVVAVMLTSISIRPIAKLFRSNPAARRAALVGKVVMVDTSRVDRDFGAARAEDGGAGLIVHVRYDGLHRFSRGERALVVSYDDAREVYEIAPLGDILPTEDPGGSGR